MTISAVIPKLVELTKSDKLKWENATMGCGRVSYLGQWKLTFEVARSGGSSTLEFSHPDYDEEEYDGSDDVVTPWLRWGDSEALPPLEKAILKQLAARKPEAIIPESKTINPIPPMDDLVQSVNRLLGK